MSCIKPVKILIDQVVLESPTTSENDLIETLRNILDFGLTAQTNNICCTCSPESSAPYVFASTETYLKYCEAVGLTANERPDKPTLISSGNTTSGPVKKGFFAKIVDYKEGDDFFIFVDQTKPINGLINTNGFEFYTNSDMYWFNETKIYYTGFDTLENESKDCCNNHIASVETFLKFAEAVGLTQRPDPNSQDNITITTTETKYNCCDFRDAVDKVFKNFFTVEIIDAVLDKGINEIGETNFNEFYDFFSQNNFSPNFIGEFMDIILDKGIVPICDNDITKLVNVEEYLKYAEAVGLTQSAAVS